MPSNGERPENGAKGDLFDDRAIRSELRKIVEREEVRFMEKFTSQVNDVRGQYDAFKNVDEYAKQKLFSGLETAKAEGHRRFKMMLDFIERS